MDEIDVVRSIDLPKGQIVRDTPPEEQLPPTGRWGSMRVVVIQMHDYPCHSFGGLPRTTKSFLRRGEAAMYAKYMQMVDISDCNGRTWSGNRNHAFGEDEDILELADKYGLKNNHSARLAAPIRISMFAERHGDLIQRTYVMDCLHWEEGEDGAD